MHVNNQLQESNKELKDKSRTIADIEDQMKRVSVQAEESNKELAERARVVATLEGQIGQLVDVHRDSLAESDADKRVELDRLLVELTRVESVTKELRDENIRLKTIADESEVQRTRYISHQDRCSHLEREFELIRGDCNRKDAMKADDDLIIMQLTHELSAAKSDLGRLTELLHSTEELLEIKNVQFKELSAALAVSEELVKRFSLKLEQKDERIEQFTSNLTQTDDTVLPRLVAAESAVAERDVTIRTAAAALEEMNSKISEMEAEIAEKDALVTSQQSDIISLSGRLQVAVAEREKLAEKILELAENKESGKMLLAEKEMRFKDLLTDIDRSSEENQSLKAGLDIAAGQNRFLQDSLEKLEKQISEKDQRVCVLQDDVKAKTAESVALASDLERLRASLDEGSRAEDTRRNAEVGSLNVLVAELRSVVDTVMNDAARLQSEDADLRRNLEAAEKKIADRDRKIDSLSENYQEEEAQLVSLTEELEKMRGELETQKDSLRSLEAIVASKVEEVRELTDAVDKKDAKEKKCMALIKKLKQQLDDTKNEHQQQLEQAEQQRTEQLVAQTQLAHEQLSQQQLSDQQLVQQQIAELKLVEQQAVEQQLARQQLADQQLAELRTSVDQLNVILAVALSDVEMHGEESRKKSVETDTLLTRLSDARRELDAKSTSHASMQLELDNLRREYETRVQTLNADNERMHVSILNFEDTIQRQTESKRESDNFGELQVASEVDALRRELTRATAELDATIDRLKANEEQQQLYDAELVVKDRAIFDLTARLETCCEEINNLRSAVDFLKSGATKEFDSEIKRLETECGRLSDIINDLHIKNTEEERSRIEDARLAAEKEKYISAELARVTFLVGLKDKDLAEAAKNLERLNVQCQRFNVEISERDEKLGELGERLYALTMEKEELTALMDKKMLLLDQTMESNAALHEECSRSAEEISRLKRELASMSSATKIFDDKKPLVSSTVESLVEKSSLDVGHEMRREIETLAGAPPQALAQGPHQTPPQLSSDFQRDELLRQLQRYEEECRAMSAEIGELNTKQLVSDARIVELETRLKSTSSNAEEMRLYAENERSRLEAEVGRAQDQSTKAEQAVQQVVQRMELERQRFTDEESELQGSMEELQLEVARLTQRLETGEERLVKKESDLREALHKMSLLTVEISALKGERDKLAASASSAELLSPKGDADKMAEISTELASLKVLVSNLESERESLRGDRDDALRQLQRINVEKNGIELELTERLSEAAASRDTVQVQYDMLVTDIDHYEHLTSQLKAKIEKLETALKSKATADEVDHQNQIAERIAVNEENQHTLSLELEESRRHNAVLAGEVDALNWRIQEFSETEEELEETQGRLFNLQGEVGSLKTRILELEERVVASERMEVEHALLSVQYEKALQVGISFFKVFLTVFVIIGSNNEKHCVKISHINWFGRLKEKKSKFTYK